MTRGVVTYPQSCNVALMLGVSFVDTKGVVHRTRGRRSSVFAAAGAA
jgi:hypothetical protein